MNYQMYEKVVTIVCFQFLNYIDKTTHPHDRNIIDILFSIKTINFTLYDQKAFPLQILQKLSK